MDGPVDFPFSIASTEGTGQGGYLLKLRAVADGSGMGFDLEVGPETGEGQRLQDTDIVLYPGTVTFVRTGPESDKFVQELARAFGLNTRPERMVPKLTCTLLSLAGRPASILTEPARLKLFFEGGGEAGYFEWYLNVDVAGDRVDLNEKDPDFRAPIVKALTLG